MNREPMRHADAAWLRMDTPTNLMVVNSVLWFGEAVSEEDLSTVLDERLVGRFRRFAQRAVEDRGTWWEDDPDFDLSHHIHHVDLPAPRGRRELEALVASYLTVPLDRRRPLWDIYVADGYHGGTALFFRMHHCIADGIALTRVLLSLADGGGDSASVVADDPAARGLVREVAGAAAHEAIQVLTHPRHLLDLAATGTNDARALAKLLALPPTPTVLTRRTGTHKQVVWSDPIPLARVKACAHATGTTVNDVLLAALAGALRAQDERRGRSARDQRVVVPFNLRPLDAPLPAGLGNQFGLVYLDLPLDKESPQERLHEMSRRMRSIKNSAEGAVAYGILDVVGQAPAAVEKLVVELFAAKASAVVTNVAGPTQQVTLAGSPLLGTIGWVPMTGTIGLGVSIFSYAGDVVVGIASDDHQVTDARLLLDDVVDEVQSLTATAVQ